MNYYNFFGIRGKFMMAQVVQKITRCSGVRAVHLSQNSRLLINSIFKGVGNFGIPGTDAGRCDAEDRCLYLIVFF